MGKAQAFPMVKFFAGFIYRDAYIYGQIKERLTGLFSPIDLETGEFPFQLTAYYNDELGSPLYKSFVSFKDLIDPVRLPEIKILTNRIEQETAREQKRVIDIDPGFLSGGNVILATTKNYYHRVPLQQGIYAHIEYVIKKNRVTSLEWTYPDFKTPAYMDFFNRLIAVYKRDMKERIMGG